MKIIIDFFSTYLIGIFYAVLTAVIFFAIIIFVAYLINNDNKKNVIEYFKTNFKDIRNWFK
jgi:preprotein translocase subunit SecG